VLAPATAHGTQRLLRARVIGVAPPPGPLPASACPVAWRRPSSTIECSLSGASSSPPLAARITVATSSSARSSADIAGGILPSMVLSTSSANAFAWARSAAVGSASGSGTGAERMSSSLAIRTLALLRS
jgi:hypothetical protein